MTSLPAIAIVVLIVCGLFCVWVGYLLVRTEPWLDSKLNAKDFESDK